MLSDWRWRKSKVNVMRDAMNDVVYPRRCVEELKAVPATLSQHHRCSLRTRDIFTHATLVQHVGMPLDVIRNGTTLAFEWICVLSHARKIFSFNHNNRKFLLSHFVCMWTNDTNLMKRSGKINHRHSEVLLLQWTTLTMGCYEDEFNLFWMIWWDCLWVLDKINEFSVTKIIVLRILWLGSKKIPTMYTFIHIYLHY